MPRFQENRERKEVFGNGSMENQNDIKKDIYDYGAKSPKWQIRHDLQHNTILFNIPCIPIKFDRQKA